MAVRKDIKYINKEFTELRNQLINYMVMKKIQQIIEWK